MICECCKKNKATKKDYRSWTESKHVVHDVCDKCLNLPDNIFNALMSAKPSDESKLKSKKHNKMGGIIPGSTVKDLTNDNEK